MLGNGIGGITIQIPNSGIHIGGITGRSGIGIFGDKLGQGIGGITIQIPNSGIHIGGITGRSGNGMFGSKPGQGIGGINGNLHSVIHHDPQRKTFGATAPTAAIGFAAATLNEFEPTKLINFGATI